MASNIGASDVTGASGTSVQADGELTKDGGKCEKLLPSSEELTWVLVTGKKKRPKSMAAAMFGQQAESDVLFHEPTAEESARSLQSYEKYLDKIMKPKSKESAGKRGKNKRSFTNNEQETANRKFKRCKMELMVDASRDPSYQDLLRRLEDPDFPRKSNVSATDADDESDNHIQLGPVIKLPKPQGYLAKVRPPSDTVADDYWSDSGVSSTSALNGSHLSISSDTSPRNKRRSIYYDVNEWVNGVKVHGIATDFMDRRPNLFSRQL